MAATPDPKTLSLTDLEAYDPNAPAHGRERRFCCPLPACSDKRPTREHRSLTVNTVTGVWTCHRCHAAGLLMEFREDRPAVPLHQLQRARAMRVITGEGHRDDVRDEGKQPAEAEAAAMASTFQGSPAAFYLTGRGIPPETAAAAGCGFSGRWAGVPRVTFPVRDQAGALVAISGRACVPCDAGARQRTRGIKHLGVFNPEAFRGEAVILVEAPIDALSLAVCGYPAAALIGTTGPAWLRRATAFKAVFLAFDSDQAGNAAAEALTGTLTLTRRPPQRLCPPAPYKDWNEALMTMGREDLAAWLSAALPQSDTPTPNPPTTAPPAWREGDRVRVCLEGAWVTGTVESVWEDDGTTAPEYVGCVSVLLDGRTYGTVLRPEWLEPAEDFNGDMAPSL